MNGETKVGGTSRLKLVFAKGKTFLFLSFCGIFGWLLGKCVYATLVENAYDDLVIAIRNAEIIEPLFAEDPAILHLIYEFKEKPLDQALNNRYLSIINDRDLLVWRLLRLHGIIQKNDGINKGSIIVRSSLEPIFNDEFQNVVSKSGIDFLVQILEEAGRKFNNDSYRDHTINNIKELIVNVLAETPYSFETYLTNLVQVDSSNFIKEDTRFGKPRQSNSEYWGKSATINDLLALLFSNFSISGSFDQLDARTSIEIQGSSKFVGQDNVEEYRQLTQFVTKVLILINNDPEVSRARNWLSVVEGIMQLLMIVVFVICFLLVIVLFANAFLYRCLKYWLSKKKSENDLASIGSSSSQEDQNVPPDTSKSKRYLESIENSDVVQGIFKFTITEEYYLKRTFRWGTSTLPIFGFIGTILGLMAALRDAYKIPLAANETTSALAIADITNTLSIAFTTTLMAFVLNVVLSLIALILLRKDVEDELQVMHQEIPK